ncbi:MAG: VWA domain-containing protein [Armatimonadetes bacterium]|nr:VWA domain-containing protein [Armatimonadota bacterium]
MFQREPRLGGGGGRSILSVDNPLVKDAIPEEKPGVGLGLGGGQGSGAKEGIGTARGRGIGTRLDGKEALATLRRKSGEGVGAGQGSGIGTRPPSGGKGTGAETPGMGGDGLGYGRGRGVGVGNGGGEGIGNGNGGENRFGLNRGVPFGDIGGLLRGGNLKGGGGVVGNGAGGVGRGAVFGTRTAKGGKGSVHIVYLLDSSGSMREGNKIGKAKEALKQALSELKPVDSFNIIHFNHSVYPFMNVLLSATPENIAQANEFVDAIRIRPDTNMSGGLEAAFALKGVTHIFLLSDGEPHTGIEDPDKLRAMVKELNTTRIHLITLALGLGEQFRGMALLKALAEENSGQFSYIDLSH